jgi:predicted RNase H-like HicB family nuclease
MTDTIEAKGAERFLFLREKRGAPQGRGIPAGHADEMPEEGVALWTVYGGGVYECEVYVAQEPEGGFSAHAARLPGVVAQGEDIERTIYEIQKALSATIASYIQHEGSVPWTDEPIELDAENPLTKRWILVNV